MGKVIQLFPPAKEIVYEEMPAEARAEEQARNAYDCMVFSLNDDFVQTADESLQGDLQILSFLIMGLVQRANGITSEYTDLLDRIKQQETK